VLSTEERNARILATLKQTMPHVTNFTHDIGLPTQPVGHSSGIMTSTSGEDEMDHVIQAICQRWPQLIVEKQEVVVRFRDPGEVAITGEMKQVINAMLPSNPCYEAILDRYHTVDPTTGHRIPIIEAACASKFAALVSPYREWERKQQDAVDLRSIMVPNHATLDRRLLQLLGDLVYPDGGKELLKYLQLAIDKKPFPV